MEARTERLIEGLLSVQVVRSPIDIARRLINTPWAARSLAVIYGLTLGAR